MREILFRGKKESTGDWVFGDLRHYRSGKVGVHSDVLRYTLLVDPETVGQYTGLRDCKRTAEYPEGQMLFEGDVIKVERDLYCGENKKEREIFNGVVWYDDKHTCFGIKSKKYRCLPIHRFKGDYSAIIGNIHDNPELLKGGDV